MKKFCQGVLVFTGCMLLSSSAFAQLKTVSFEQLERLQKAERRPVIVFLHTSWCRYCSLMKAGTFKNKDVVKRLNDRFYFVPFDGEATGDVFFQGHVFAFKPTGTTTGIHELAEQLGTVNSTLAYPTVCFLNSDFEIICQRQGYADAQELLAILGKLQ